MNNVIKYWVLLGMMTASAGMAAVKSKARRKR